MSSIMRRRRGPISAIEGSRLEGWASRPQSSQTGRPPSNPSPQSRGSRFVQSPWSPRTLTKTVQLVAYCSAPGCPNDQIQKALCWQPAPPKARPGTRNRLPPTHPPSRRPHTGPVPPIPTAVNIDPQQKRSLAALGMTTPSDFIQQSLSSRAQRGIFATI